MFPTAVSVYVLMLRHNGISILTMAGIGCLMLDPVKCPNEVGASPTPHSGR